MVFIFWAAIFHFLLNFVPVEVGEVRNRTLAFPKSNFEEILGEKGVFWGAKRGVNKKSTLINSYLREKKICLDSLCAKPTLCPRSRHFVRGSIQFVRGRVQFARERIQFMRERIQFVRERIQFVRERLQFVREKI